MSYRPRRASKRWLEGAPEYILDCFDNKGKTADRYTILFGGSLLDPRLLKFRKVHMLCLNGMPTDPTFGVSMWAEVEAAYRPARQRVHWLGLPENVRKHIMMRAEGGPAASDETVHSSYRCCYITIKYADGKSVVTWQTPGYELHQAKTVTSAKRAISAWWQSQIDSHYSTGEFSVALYKPPNQYGVFNNITRQWIWFGKKSHLVRTAAQLNIGEKMT